MLQGAGPYQQAVMQLVEDFIGGTQYAGLAAKLLPRLPEGDLLAAICGLLDIPSLEGHLVGAGPLCMRSLNVPGFEAMPALCP